MTDKTTQSMTPEQLLAPESYAVCRFIDGEFGYVSQLFSDESRAYEAAAQWMATTNGDYRVVRIQH